MKKVKKMLPYFLILVFASFAVPFITGKMTALMVVVPIIYFLCALIYGVVNSFNLLFSIVAAMLAIPSIFLVYNSSALPFCLMYGIISILANLIGLIFYKIRQRKVKQD